jgi:hypothetical protein
VYRSRLCQNAGSTGPVISFRWRTLDAPVARSTAAFGIAALLLASPMSAQPTRIGAVLEGVVSDTSLVPLDLVTASFLGTDVHVTTGANGKFQITAIPAGSRILQLKRLGYAPLHSWITVNEGDTLRLSFVLQSSVTTLAPTVVIGERTSERLLEFDARRRAGFGHFLTEDEIRAKHAAFAGQLLLSIPELLVRSMPHGQVALNMRGGACEYEVFLDGQPLPSPTNLDDLPRPDDLAAIEVYSGPATVPLQYKRPGGGASCGVILVWTKTGV